MFYPTVDEIVNRNKQLAAIKKALKLSDQSDEDLRIIEWYGISGVGKSRILNEAKRCCRDTELKFLVFDFVR